MSDHPDHPDQPQPEPTPNRTVGSDTPDAPHSPHQTVGSDTPDAPHSPHRTVGSDTPDAPHSPHRTVGSDTPDAPDAPQPQTEQPEPEPFADGPPPLPPQMLVLDGSLPEQPLEEPEPVDHGTCAECGGAYDEEGWCTQCGQRRPDPRDHFTAQPAPHVAAVCDRGKRHTENQDAMAVQVGEGPDPRTVLVVCDGVSSAERAAEASLAAADAAVEVLGRPGAPAVTRLVQAADAAVVAIEEVAQEFPGTAPSCTLVAAVLEAGTLTVGSVGDSRAYWLPDGGEPVQLTRDDSMAEEQVRAGMDRAQAEAGPLGHTITRWLGPDAPDHTPTVHSQDITVPGWVLLCTDGLWNYASQPHDLAAVVAAEARRVGPDPLDLASALVGWANEQGGADNITVALARAGGTGQDGTHG